VPAKAKALFHMTVDAVVGDGESILYFGQNGGSIVEHWLN
jgi:hypothetical protein